MDTFVNKIFLYDDKFILTFNYKSDTSEVTFKNLNSSELKNPFPPRNATFSGGVFHFTLSEKKQFYIVNFSPYMLHFNYKNKKDRIYDRKRKGIGRNGICAR